MTDPTLCCPLSGADAADPYCGRCDLLVGLEGYHVVGVDRDGRGLVVTIESSPAPMGCPVCGVVAISHGRRTHEVIDAPCFGWPVVLRWRKRTWTCSEPVCPVGTFTERDEDLAAPRSRLATRARWWAVGQMRREHATPHGLARQLGTAWHTVWESVEPLLEAMAADEARFAGVHTLGVDEHIVHHVSARRRGPKELTGMVDLSRDQHGRVQMRFDGQVLQIQAQHPVVAGQCRAQ